MIMKVLFITMSTQSQINIKHINQRSSTQNDHIDRFPQEKYSNKILSILLLKSTFELN